MMMDKPGWTTSLQQDLAAAREDLEKIVKDDTGLDVAKVIGKIEAMERKLQVARCTAVAALEAL